jgi:hypothetical protein
MKLIISLFFLLLVVIISVLYRKTIKEYFVSQISKSYDTNEFKSIVLDKMDNYDIELAIPSGQYLYNTTQGNWGFSTDETNDGVVFGVYRDGYTADGSIFKGKTGKRSKYMLEQGPYVIKYEVRKNNDTDEHDVSIYVNDKLVTIAEGEGITSDKLKVIGTNYHNYNDEAKKNERGRRPVDYLKFVPKDINVKKTEGFENNETSSNNEKTETDVNYSAELKKSKNIANTDINEGEFITKMCKDEGIFCNKIQDVNINLNTGKIHYGINDEEEQGNKQLTDQKNDQYLKQLFDAVDQDKDGMILKKEATILMDQLQIDKEIYDTVLNNMSPAGMDFKTFSSIVGQPIKRILKVVYQDNGKQGLKLLYKLMGYDFTDLESKKQRKIEEKNRKEQEKKATLKKMYPETDYDKSNPSKTRYRSDYKPEHPRPENGVHFYDSIWDFSKK